MLQEKQLSFRHKTTHCGVRECLERNEKTKEWFIILSPAGNFHNKTLLYNQYFDENLIAVLINSEYRGYFTYLIRIEKCIQDKPLFRFKVLER